MKTYRRSMTLLAGVLLLAATTLAAVAAHWAHDGTLAAAALTSRFSTVEASVEQPTECPAAQPNGVTIRTSPAQGRQA